MDLDALDLGHLAFFVGLRINELVLERVGHDALRQSHGYVIQHLIEGPRRVTELAGLLGVSQQAASKAVGELVALGVVTSAASRDRRAREVALSARGRAMVTRTRQVRAALERELVAAHGGEVARARTLLAAVLEQLGGADAVRERRVRAPR